MPKVVIAIDPGTTQSAWVEWDGSRIIEAVILPNEEILYNLRMTAKSNATLVIEWIESYGMSVGQSVFLTCRWCGRFHEAWGDEPVYLTRKQVKLHHCNSVKANDSNIRQALIDRFGPVGTKKSPGLTYGLRKDLWAAFAIATCWWDNNEGFCSTL